MPIVPIALVAAANVIPVVIFEDICGISPIRCIHQVEFLDIQ